MLVPTPDGRRLEVLLSGPEDGFPLVYLHGTPSGMVEDAQLTAAAAANGLRLIGYSRPGYGGSTPRPDGATTATVADDATDVASVLDHLGYDRFVAVGWSGGGPRSLACAALLPDRCLAAACGVGLVPPAEYDGDVRAGMGEENVAELTAAMEGPEAISAWLEAEGTWAFSVTGEQIAESLGSLAPPVDRAALTGQRAETAAAAFRHAGRQGIVGWRDDDLMLVRPWGFSVADITVPVAVWQGTEDMMVPFAHAQWLIANIPGARAHLLEGEGHISLRARMPVILEDLVDLAGLPPRRRPGASAGPGRADPAT
jgi:pimeloyl-ACP methyl ester carboxylesterase